DDERLAHRCPSSFAKCAPLRRAAPCSLVEKGGGTRSPSSAMVTWRSHFKLRATRAGRLKPIYFSRLELCDGYANATAAHCMRATLIVWARPGRACYGRWMVAAAGVKRRRRRLSPNKGGAPSATAGAGSRLSTTTGSGGCPTATP